jgi:hypothetical protein
MNKVSFEYHLKTHVEGVVLRDYNELRQLCAAWPVFSYGFVGRIGTTHEVARARRVEEVVALQLLEKGVSEDPKGSTAAVLSEGNPHDTHPQNIINLLESTGKYTSQPMQVLDEMNGYGAVVEAVKAGGKIYLMFDSWFHESLDPESFARTDKIARSLQVDWRYADAAQYRLDVEPFVQMLADIGLPREKLTPFMQQSFSRHLRRDWSASDRSLRAKLAGMPLEVSTSIHDLSPRTDTMHDNGFKDYTFQLEDGTYLLTGRDPPLVRLQLGTNREYSTKDPIIIEQRNHILRGLSDRVEEYLCTTGAAPAHKPWDPHSTLEPHLQRFSP